MTFVSRGYDTNAYPEDAWAQLHGSVLPYQVGFQGTVGDWLVAPVLSKALTASVAPGVGIGFGVRDRTDVAEEVTFAANGSGSYRFDTVVARRNWSGTASGLVDGGTTTFAVVQGGPNPNPTRVGSNRWPGLVDEQLLAIVPVAPGSTTLGAPIDLRTFAGPGGVYCYDIRAIDARDWPVGTEIREAQKTVAGLPMRDFGSHPACYRVTPGSGTGGAVVRQYGRPPASAKTPQNVVLSAYGAGFVYHGLGYTPTSMLYTLRSSGAASRVYQLFESNQAGQIDREKAAIVVVEVGPSGARSFASGTITQIMWTAVEEI